MKYRAEIDGLRALAVIPVILFHADIELFSGGYVGVDIFFAISGYLITSIILEDIQKKQFSISSFYERRARRILPALYFVMFACIPFAWLWIYPSQMIDFSNSLIAVTLFVSNILFWKETGYFAAAAEEKPLLHTWSLAVEEQYYLFFPIFLLLIFRFGKNKVFWIILIITIISLTLSEWGWRNKPSANFYLAPTRIWELLIGSISAFIIQEKGVQKNNTFAFFGLLAILLSIFLYDENTPFPSVYTLVPVLGVTMFILYGEEKTLVARFLSNKMLVGIGLISYSAYLWHQPLFAFTRLKLIDEPSKILMISLSIASLLLAVASWKYVEKPFREKNLIRINYLITFLIIGFIFFISFGAIGNMSEGFKFRYTGDAKKLIDSAQSNPLRTKCHLIQREDSIGSTPCIYFDGEPKVAVLGNSHGAELAYALANLLKKNKISVVHHTMSGCFHNYNKNDEKESVCYLWHENVVETLIKDQTIETIIISYRNEKYLKNNSYRKSLTDMIQKLSEEGKEVVLVLQAPLAGADIQKYINIALKMSKNNLIGITRSEWRKIYYAKNQLIDELPDKIKIIDPADFLCDNKNCYVIRDGEALYFDNDHMSIKAASIVASFIINKHLLN